MNIVRSDKDMDQGGIVRHWIDDSEEPVEYGSVLGGLSWPTDHAPGPAKTVRETPLANDFTPPEPEFPPAYNIWNGSQNQAPVAEPKLEPEQGVSPEPQAELAAMDSGDQTGSENCHNTAKTLI